MDIGDDYGVNVLCAKAVKSIDGFLGEARIACLLLKAVEVGGCGLDLQFTSDQTRANLTKSLGVQPVLACADKVQLLVRGSSQGTRVARQAPAGMFQTL